MMRLAILILAALPAWAANCTLAANTGAACATKTCTLSAIAADTGHANWSGTGCTANGFVPGASDTVWVRGWEGTGTTYTLTVDQPWDIGGSPSSMFSYISSFTIDNAGSGYSGTCVATLTGGTPNQYAATASCTFGDVGGGVIGLLTITPDAPLRWYAAASATPAVAIACNPACGGASGAAATAVWRAGTGAAVNTTSLYLEERGKVIVSSALTVRGDVTFENGGSSNPWLYPAIELAAGGSLTFDNSAATATSDGKKPYYMYGGYSATSFRPIGVNSASPCAGAPAVALLGQSRAATRCAITGGGIGARSFLMAGGSTLHHTDFANVGDAYLPAVEINWRYYYTKWDAQYNTFTDSGGIRLGTTVVGGEVLTHKYNTHAGTKSSAIFPTATFALDTAVSVTGNAFDVPMVGGAFFTNENVTIDQNFHTGVFSAQGTVAWASLAENFMRDTVSPNSGAEWVLGGGGTNNYSIIDYASGGVGNPHIMMLASGIGDVAFAGDVHEATDSMSADSGEAYDWGKSSTTNTVSNVLVLPAANGYSWTELSGTVSFGYTHCTNKWGFNHNTFWGTYNGTAGDGGFGIVDTAETCTPAAGDITSFKSNLLFSPVAHGAYLIANMGSFIREDVVAPANADYNNNWNGEPTKTGGSCGTAGADCVNQGKGYADKFSATPGTHDLAVNPGFADSTRTFAVFDRRYLGKTSAVAWSSGGTYALGDIVSYAVTGTYFGQTINYRCVNPSGCSGATNQEPGTLYPTVAWRANWRFASLDYISAYLGANYTTFSDWTLSMGRSTACTAAAPCSIVRALGEWVKTGYTPATPALWKAAHDGTSIGAVDFSTLGPALVAVTQ